MKIRKLERAEHGRTRRLYETVFQDERCFVDYYYAYRARENEIYVAEQIPAGGLSDAALADDGIRAMLHLNPVTVRWEERTEKLPYIVAVATEKEYRHQGLMSQLIDRALGDLYDASVPFAFLMPAAEAIYTPFGFRRAWAWRWEEELLEEPSDFACPALRCGEEQLQTLSDRVNRSLSRRFSMFALRSPEYYRRLAAEQEASGGRLEILFRGAQGAARPVSARCTAREEFPPMMSRIIHLESFLSRIKSREERTLYWQIIDDLLPGNNGVFQIILGPKGGSMRPLSLGAPGELFAAQIGNREPELVDIAEIPARLGEANPFAEAMICEVV